MVTKSIHAFVLTSVCPKGLLLHQIKFHVKYLPTLTFVKYARYQKEGKKRDTLIKQHKTPTFIDNDVKYCTQVQQKPQA